MCFVNDASGFRVPGGRWLSHGSRGLRQQELTTVKAEVGIDRGDVYLTNIVKHFKWEPRGKRRIHKKPNAVEIAACRPWLESEVRAVKPRLIVCLGATAAQGILGRQFRVTQQRGKLVPCPLGPPAIATVHPSAILRSPDTESRHAEYAKFVNDLRAVRAASAERESRAA